MKRQLWWRPPMGGGGASESVLTCVRASRLSDARAGVRALPRASREELLTGGGGMCTPAYRAIIVAELFANVHGELCSCISMCVYLYDSTEPTGIANIFQPHGAGVYPLPVMGVEWVAPHLCVGPLQTGLVLRYAGLQNSKGNVIEDGKIQTNSVYGNAPYFPSSTCNRPSWSQFTSSFLRFWRLFDSLAVAGYLALPLLCCVHNKRRSYAKSIHANGCQFREFPPAAANGGNRAKGKICPTTSCKRHSALRRSARHHWRGESNWLLLL